MHRRSLSWTVHNISVWPKTAPGEGTVKDIRDLRMCSAMYTRMYADGVGSTARSSAVKHGRLGGEGHCHHLFVSSRVVLKSNSTPKQVGFPKGLDSCGFLSGCICFGSTRSIHTNGVLARQALPDANSGDVWALPRVVLKGGRAKLFSEGKSPIVYNGAIDRVVGRPAPRVGEAVLVCSGDGDPFAWGIFNPCSMYRVRIMETREEMSTPEDFKKPGASAFDIDSLLERRVHQAIVLRKSLGLPAPNITNVYRLVNSEGDRLSGLVVDILGTCAVISSSAAWIEQRRNFIEKLLGTLLPEIHTIEWKTSPMIAKEEGFERNAKSGDKQYTAANDNDSSEQLSEDPDSNEIQVLEDGIKYYVNPRNGQKTGFYADQREHRLFIRSIASGKNVLDLCCYSGGFAINAAIGNAERVHGVDSSHAAIYLARRNAVLNDLTDSKCSFEVGDIAEVMRRMMENGEQWDIVILDPPKLAPNKNVLTRAMRKYISLNAAAMKLVRPGGLLMTCSCSGAMTQSGSFQTMIRDAAKRACRRATILRPANASSDHPVDPGYPEGQYLTNVTVGIQ